MRLDVETLRERSMAALREMHGQVGDLMLDEEGIAQRGLLVRHLVLPDGRAGSSQVLRFLAREISPDTWVNVMDQHHPIGAGDPASGPDRRPTIEELAKAAETACRVGLHRGIYPRPG